MSTREGPRTLRPERPPTPQPGDPQTIHHQAFPNPRSPNPHFPYGNTKTCVPHPPETPTLQPQRAHWHGPDCSLSGTSSVPPHPTAQSPGPGTLSFASQLSVWFSGHPAWLWPCGLDTTSSISWLTLHAWTGQPDGRARVDTGGLSRDPTTAPPSCDSSLESGHLPCPSA